MSLSAGVQALASHIAGYIKSTVLPRLLPAGGAVGQSLIKQSATAYDVAWASPATVPGWTVIGTQTLAAAQAAVSFTGIPQSYSELMLIADGLSHDNGATTGFNLQYSMNNGATFVNSVGVASALVGSTQPVWGALFFPDYASTGRRKLLWGRYLGALNAGSTAPIISALNTTDPINALRVVAGAGNLDAGSLILLAR